MRDGRNAGSGKPLEHARKRNEVSNFQPSVCIESRTQAIRALGRDNEIVAFYPASIGSAEKPAPSGEYRVRRVAENPDYHYDPKYPPLLRESCIISRLSAGCPALKASRSDGNDSIDCSTHIGSLPL